MGIPYKPLHHRIQEKENGHEKNQVAGEGREGEPTEENGHENQEREGREDVPTQGGTIDLTDLLYGESPGRGEQASPSSADAGQSTLLGEAAQPLGASSLDTSKCRDLFHSDW